jgi:CHASE1-domain containing sensor protein
LVLLLLALSINCCCSVRSNRWQHGKPLLLLLLLLLLALGLTGFAPARARQQWLRRLRASVPCQVLHAPVLPVRQHQQHC